MSHGCLGFFCCGFGALHQCEPPTCNQSPQIPTQKSIDVIWFVLGQFATYFMVVETNCLLDEMMLKIQTCAVVLLANFRIPIGAVFAIIVCVVMTGCQTTRPNTAAGGLFGSAAGGLVGAAIGAHDGKSTEGALIGALAGGTAGSVLGNQEDRRNDRFAQNIAQQQQQARQSAVTMDQIVGLTRSGLSDELIISQIQNNGIVSRPTTNDLIQLKNSGVSDRVIQSMQSAPLAGQYPAPPAVVVRQPDVIVAEPFCPGPPVFYQPHPYHFAPHPRHNHHRQNSRVGFSMNF